MDNQQQFVEEFSLVMERSAIPRMAGRILGWLLICDPPEQTMHELADALQASKSSISTMTRMLIQMGMIERVSIPGQRRDYYRGSPGYWYRQMEGAVNEFAGFHRLADRGLDLLADAPPERRQQLLEMRDVSLFLTREFPVLLARWQRERKVRE